MRTSKNGWTLLLLMLAGIVFGGFIGTLAADMPGLDWLNYGQSFGLEEPVVLSLGLAGSDLRADRSGSRSPVL